MSHLKPYIMDLSTGEVIESDEMTPTDVKRQKLGLADDVPEAEVLAAWDAHEGAQAARADEQAAQRRRLAEAAETLRGFDAEVLRGMLSGVPDDFTAQIFDVLISAVEALRVLKLGGA